MSRLVDSGARGGRLRGSGLDIGGGLVVSDPSTGLSADVRVRVRMLLAKPPGSGNEGVSVSLSYSDARSTQPRPHGLAAGGAWRTRRPPRACLTSHRRAGPRGSRRLQRRAAGAPPTFSSSSVPRVLPFEGLHSAFPWRILAGRLRPLPDAGRPEGSPRIAVARMPFSRLPV